MMTGDQLDELNRLHRRIRFRSILVNYLLDRGFGERDADPDDDWRIIEKIVDGALDELNRRRGGA